MRCARTLLALCAAVAVILVGAVPGETASRSRPYLVLGDSISAGYQPGRGDAKNGGYAATVARGMAARRTPVRMTNLACTGETVSSMSSGGRCRYRQGSQLRAAVAFLRAHPDTALVTISLGANDLRGCASGTGVSARIDARCAQRTVRSLRPRLAEVLSSLRRAAPRADIVVLDYYDPFQAAQLRGSGRGMGGGFGSLIRTQVNSAVRAAARASGTRVAYVSAPFDEGWLRRVDLPGHGRVPIRVARICAWTWMCSRGDVHPNDDGYRVIAGAVLTSLTRRR